MVARIFCSASTLTAARARGGGLSLRAPGRAARAARKLRATARGRRRGRRPEPRWWRALASCYVTRGPTVTWPKLAAVVRFSSSQIACQGNQAWSSFTPPTSPPPPLLPRHSGARLPHRRAKGPPRSPPPRKRFGPATMVAHHLGALQSAAAGDAGARRDFAPGARSGGRRFHRCRVARRRSPLAALARRRPVRRRARLARAGARTLSGVWRS